MAIKTVNPLFASVGDDVSFKHGNPDDMDSMHLVTGEVSHIVQPDLPTNRTRQIVVAVTELNDKGNRFFTGRYVTCHISRKVS